MAEWNFLKALTRNRADGDARPGQGVAAVPALDDVVVGRKVLTPDAQMMQAIGRNHSFESAVADIVDNSLDAGATKILIRFVRDGNEFVGLYIVDDGRGMDDGAIDRAMTFGGRRSYGQTDLGHFGIGLKAASLGQANSLTVLSRAAGRTPIGRRLVAERVGVSFECDVLRSDYAAFVLDKPWADLVLATGTVVVWTDLKILPTVVPGGALDVFLDHHLTALHRHLGLVFHRILETRGVTMTVDQEDLAAGATGAPFAVLPVNPIGYPKSGRLDYPRTLRADSERGGVALTCHIWPGRSNDPNFKIAGARPDDLQGLYVYRNDRLIQHGGWHGLARPSVELQLARVIVDISGTELFDLNPEKTRVEPTQHFKSLAPLAMDGDCGIEKYLEDAIHTYKESRKRVRERARVIEPGSGFAPKVRTAVERECGFLPGREPLDVRWAKFDEDVLFDIDKGQNVIWLNRDYRTAIIGDRSGSLNDAPLVKAFLYLLAEALFRGEILGSRDRDNIAIWQAVLTAAAKEEGK